MMFVERRVGEREEVGEERKVPTCTTQLVRA